MIGRILLLLMCVAAGWAQLPPAQAPAPAAETAGKSKHQAELSLRESAHLDAVVSDGQGRPVAGLQAADFSLVVDGKPQKIEKCEYRTGEPLRLAVILDDLSLSAEHSYSARRELRRLVEQLGAADEIAVLRASAGSGASDRFTSDKQALNAALDRASYNPGAAAAPPETLGGTFHVVVRGVLQGLRAIPGRKAALVISERLRDPARNATIASMRLAAMANLGSAVLYVVDMSGGQTSLTQLDFGVSQAVQDTGGRYFDGDKVAEALAQITRDHEGYYQLAYRSEGLSYDYLAGTLRVEKVQLTTSRAGAVVRARNGVYGGGEADETPAEIDINVGRAVGTELVTGDVRARVTALASMPGGWVIDGVVHIDASDLTVVRGLDGRFRCSIDLVVALETDNGSAAEQGVSRTINLSLTDEGLADVRAKGIDYTTTSRIANPGAYHLLIAVRDGGSGKTGTARAAVAADWGPAKLGMTSLILHGEIVKGADGSEKLQKAEESASVRKFGPERRIVYMYELVNLATDAGKRSRIDVSTRLWRDGALLLDGNPVPVDFAPLEKATRRMATGSILLKAGTRSGQYVIGITVLDKLSGRTATRYMDFEVIPE